MQDFEWLLHQLIADKLLLHNILWTDEIYFTPERVFIFRSCHFSARDNPHDVHELESQVRFSDSNRAAIVVGRVLNEIVNFCCSTRAA
jgi:hypothetical protein